MADKIRKALGYPDWTPDSTPRMNKVLLDFAREQIRASFEVFSKGEWKTNLDNSGTFLGSDFAWVSKDCDEQPVDIVFTPDDLQVALMNEIKFNSDMDGKIARVGLDNLLKEIARWQGALKKILDHAQSLPVDETPETDLDVGEFYLRRARNKA